MVDGGCGCAQDPCILFLFAIMHHCLAHDGLPSCPRMWFSNCRPPERVRVSCHPHVASCSNPMAGAPGESLTVPVDVCRGGNNVLGVDRDASLVLIPTDDHLASVPSCCPRRSARAVLSFHLPFLISRVPSLLPSREHPRSRVPAAARRRAGRLDSAPRAGHGPNVKHGSRLPASSAGGAPAMNGWTVEEAGIDASGIRSCGWNVPPNA